jgi:tryptophanyl-tRNA synthetase
VIVAIRQSGGVRTLTGIQPSGRLHVGNYFGAMRPAIEAQTRGECFFFIADYHSMTSLLDPAERRRITLEVALDWLACGLDPEKSVFWRQSDVPEVTELSWIIGSITPMGLLERAHSFKDKIAHGISPNFGLFAYPVLMAADILLFDTTVVPVGRDQKQHLEITRDIAIKFNQTYGDTLVVPEPDIRDDAAVVPGTDGQKMSKSYGNTIELFGDEKAIRKRIMSIVMDSRPPAEPKPDADKNLAVRLLKLFAPPEIADDWEQRLRTGGLGYGDLKKALFEHYWTYFAPARARRAELTARPDYVSDVLAAGAAKARDVARLVLHRARHASGLA